MTSAAIKVIKQVMLGDADLPQQCTIGLLNPQAEIGIWLERSGGEVDVTNSHVIACAFPFTVGVQLNGNAGAPGTPLSLNLRERHGAGRLLARVRLRKSGTLTANGRELSLFHVQSCNHYCLPRPRLWAYELYQSFIRWRSDKNPEIPMSMRAARAMNAFFISPRPVVLVSVKHGENGNIFPMNLFGSIGEGYFAFALNSARKAAPLVERAGRVALSSVPIGQAELARQLGKNHRRDSVDWDELPFATTPSTEFNFPIPQFALRVREMEIQAVRNLGSHTLFFARVIRDERRAEGPQFCMIHGLYQAWRLRTSRAQPEKPIEAANQC
jgi:flavin reductase (DIM6/NTAB) family NADH-FMN oxidoreductase RutF